MNGVMRIRDMHGNVLYPTAQEAQTIIRTLMTRNRELAARLRAIDCRLIPDPTPVAVKGIAPSDLNSMVYGELKVLLEKKLDLAFGCSTEDEFIENVIEAANWDGIYAPDGKRWTKKSIRPFRTKLIRFMKMVLKVKGKVRVRVKQKSDKEYEIVTVKLSHPTDLSICGIK